ncbi:MAG TPA: TadE/TadG family type IV pilus assembly protein [Xanthobacteraceae bacterium]|nr:TadE/TadG family type IV pilus assembly protein [Xanthobacteraceae bacterium]
MFDRIKSMRAARAPWFAGLPLLRRFIRQTDATAGVEFAFVATPFLALSLGVIQTALLFLSGQSLETAAAVAGRLIMTGQAQTAGWTASQFKAQVCSQVATMFNCNADVYIDVETYSSFAAVNLGLPISNGTLNTSSMGYNPGGPGDVVVVRLYYQYPVYFSSVLNLSNLNGGANLLAATAVFQNEPYASS